MTLFELLMALSEALEEAEKTENAKAEKPEPKTAPAPKTKAEPTVFTLSSYTVTIKNGITTNHNDGCHGVFYDSMSAMRYAMSLCGTGKLLFEKSDDDTYLATEMFNDDGVLVYSEYTISAVPFKS